MVGMYNRGYIDRDERLLAEIKESDQTNDGAEDSRVDRKVP